MNTARTLAELSDKSGLPARTIRFYIARGLLDGPVKAGRGAVYTDEHLTRLETIKKLQADGRMLSEIAHGLIGSPAETVTPSPWLQYAVGDDVVVMARGDVAPWRARRIRAAVEAMAALLREPENKDKGGNNR